MSIQEWVAAAPPEILELFQSVDVRNFLRAKRNERFQMIGMYDGSISDECRESFRRDYETVNAFLEASKPVAP